MSHSKGSKRIGGLVFFIPVVAVIVLMVLGLISVISTQSGTLIIEAQTSGRYSPSLEVHVSASVSGTSALTPFNLTLTQGAHTVTFGPLSWFVSPQPKTVVISGGKTQFAVGIYSPMIREVTITSGGFNTTSITAKHSVTPVVWLNSSPDAVVLVIKNYFRTTISPNQNFTQVFQAVGAYQFSLDGTGYNGTLGVV